LREGGEESLQPLEKKQRVKSKGDGVRRGKISKKNDSGFVVVRRGNPIMPRRRMVWQRSKRSARLKKFGRRVAGRDSEGWWSFFHGHQ